MTPGVDEKQPRTVPVSVLEELAAELREKAAKVDQLPGHWADDAYRDAADLLDQTREKGATNE